MKISVGVYAVLWTQTLDAMATMIVLPTIPFYAMGLGANAFTISLLGAAYNLSQMICSPALGALSDRIGRKTVMVTGLACQAICNGAMSYSESVSALLIVRVAVGAALSTGPVEMAYIMDSVNSEGDLSQVLALQRFMTSAGALLGPLVARTFDELAFGTLCQGLVCVNVLNLCIGAALWEDAAPKDLALRGSSSSSAGSSPPMPGIGMAGGREEEPFFLQSVRTLFTNHATSSLLLVSWLYTLGYGIGDGPEIVFLKDHFSFGKEEVCYYFVATNLSSLVLATIVPRIIEVLGPRSSCKLGCLGAAACLVALASLSGVGWVPYVCGILEVGLFGSMIGLSYMHLVRKTCPESSMGTMLGLQSALNGFAGTVGPPSGGALYDWNNVFPYVLSALFAAAAGGVYAALPLEPTAGELAPLVAGAALPRHVQRRPALRRASSFGQPIYPNKSFTTQVHTNLFKLEFDPELEALYRAYRSMLEKERGTAGAGSFPASSGGLKCVATVPGDMVAAHAEAVALQGAIAEGSEMSRSDTTGNIAELR